LKPGDMAPAEEAPPTAPVADPRGRGKDKRGSREPADQSIESAPLREMNPAPAAPAPFPRKDPNKGNRTRETDPFTTESERPHGGNPAADSIALAAAPERERGPKNKNRRGGPEVPAVQEPSGIVAPAPATEPPVVNEGRGRGKQKKDDVRIAPPDVAPPPQVERQEPPRMRREAPVAAPQQIAPPPVAPPAAPAGPPPAAAEPERRGKPGKGGKKNKGDGSPEEEG
jgi:hypothetical protein